MKKNHLFIGTFYAALFGAPLLLVGCDALPSLWGDNNRPYYSNPKNNTHYRNNYNSNRRMSRDETNPTYGSSVRTKAANTTTHAARAATSNDNNNAGSSSVSSAAMTAPKASTTAGSSLDSPVVPTMTPAVQ
ncbi:Uncharacterised protein [Legionella busanensis]|uniref:Lipoprotein n=1 Tax=Legionella busanensis TaxID=190655 RepID=A0A378JFY2_9GAMM|nr:hypothetical protein [Legionella busanensis]STX50095.1 Uncharacterised protein [Legionella busanensis]